MANQGGADIKKLFYDPKGGNFEDLKIRQKREYNALNREFQRKLEDMAIENFDNEYKYDGDQFDPKTKTKMKGFYDIEKLENWRYKMEHLLKRR